MTKKTRRVFIAEFKLECVKLVTEHNHSVQKAAQAMNVSLSGLGKWVKQYKDEQNGKVASGSAISPELVEIQKLKKGSCFAHDRHSEQFLTIKKLEQSYPVQTSCSVFNANRSSYYY
ncbi:transposase [Thorsellia anophelis]|uniref:Transposase n=1 Tax=Thorsellia anophelis DSM 18579 TaxID=1123402 RepID=A0A1I0EYU2_9GAMM|nr:transposase [Thorsellia anophelis]SET50656.1 Transposase [Thorsellia anophelis DSM 18579]